MPARKKDPSIRARRNTASTSATLSAAATKVPPMPSGPVWHSEVEQWWADVWSSPMSPEWHESDLHNVVICALLLNDMWMAETAKERKDAAAEFRLQRKDLGLTPYDRRRLEWTIETAEESKDRGRQRRSRQSPTPSKPADDPRQVLRAVN